MAVALVATARCMLLMRSSRARNAWSSDIWLKSILASLGAEVVVARSPEIEVGASAGMAGGYVREGLAGNEVDMLTGGNAVVLSGVVAGLRMELALPGCAGVCTGVIARIGEAKRQWALSVGSVQDVQLPLRERGEAPVPSAGDAASERSTQEDCTG